MDELVQWLNGAGAVASQALHMVPAAEGVHTTLQTGSDTLTPLDVAGLLVLMVALMLVLWACMRLVRWRLRVAATPPEAPPLPEPKEVEVAP